MRTGLIPARANSSEILKKSSCARSICAGSLRWKLQLMVATIDSGVTVPIRVIPCACDARRFEKTRSPLVIPEARNRCVFYTIGELSRRKNVVGLLRAYYAAFRKGEDVVLVLKLNIPGQGKEAVFDKARMIVNELKGSLGLHHDPRRYPPVICITDRLS